MTENVITVNNTEIHTLEAEEGFCLTDGEVFSEEGATIHLGCNDSASNWSEIPATDATLIQKIKALPNTPEVNEVLSLLLTQQEEE